MMRFVLRPPEKIVVTEHIQWTEQNKRFLRFYEQILLKPILIEMEIEDVYPLAGYVD